MPSFTETLYRSHTHRASSIDRRTLPDSRPRDVIKPQSLHAHTPTHEEIAHLAYSFWEARGRRHGSALEDWLRAERQLKQLYIR